MSAVGVGRRAWHVGRGWVVIGRPWVGEVGRQISWGCPSDGCGWSVLEDAVQPGPLLLGVLLLLLLLLLGWACVGVVVVRTPRPGLDQATRRQRQACGCGTPMSIQDCRVCVVYALAPLAVRPHARPVK